MEIHGGDELERFEGADGRVRQGGHQAPGSSSTATAWSIGAGVMPDVMLARSAGLELGESGGVRCSAGLESSVPGIFAAGDICEYESPVHGRRLRVEHWDVAANQGKTAALNMLGRGVEHDVIPYFFSDLADWASLEYVGPGSGRARRARLARGGRVHASSTSTTGGSRPRWRSARSDDLEHARRFIADRAPRRAAARSPTWAPTWPRSSATGPRRPRRPASGW